MRCVAAGSFSSGSLADTTLPDLERMLRLDETLFVEHKRSIGSDKDSIYGLVSNVAAFANTLGGWLLIGVQDGRPANAEPAWARPDAPSLVDTVRDLLRTELDPVPAFEARILSHPDGPVGVVRVYESSDTPHISMRTGAVFIREVAGVSNAADPRPAGVGAQAERVFRATQVRSRAQLLDLSARGEKASDRVRQLMDPRHPLPLITDQLGLRFQPRSVDQVQPRTRERGSVFVRLAPYTLPNTFRGWATTSSASAAVLGAGEQASGMLGLGNDWPAPHPSGVSVAIGETPAIKHTDGAGLGLPASVRVVIDGAGIAAACIELAPPEQSLRRSRVRLDQLASGYVLPALHAAAALLESSHLPGRARCQIDLVGLPAAFMLEYQGNREAGQWIPVTTDIALPATDAELLAVAQRAAYAYARSAGIPAWDPGGGA